MLAWTQEWCFRAETPDGRVYLILPNWDKKGKPYIATLSFRDKWGRDFQHIVGTFATITEAKSICEKDAKDS